MIGQTKLLETIDNLLEKGFPRFLIIQGALGSGRKTISEIIARKLNATFATSETKTEDVRNTITTSYRVSTKTLYLIPNADKMHRNAKNSLLKVTEEPPARAYFILTIADKGAILDTLLSRGVCIKMDDYTKEDKIDYIKSKYPNYSDFISSGVAGKLDYIINTCDTFREVDLLISYGIEEFKKFCDLTAQHIRTAGIANTLKIPKKLKLKEEDTGYDPQLFLKSVVYAFHELLEKRPDAKLADAIALTLKCAGELNITGINKLATLDNWIFELREL